MNFYRGHRRGRSKNRTVFSQNKFSEMDNGGSFIHIGHFPRKCYHLIYVGDGQAGRDFPDRMGLGKGNGCSTDEDKAAGRCLYIFGVENLKLLARSGDTGANAVNIGCFWTFFKPGTQTQM